MQTISINKRIQVYIVSSIFLVSFFVSGYHISLVKLSPFKQKINVSNIDRHILIITNII